MEIVGQVQYYCIELAEISRAQRDQERRLGQQQIRQIERTSSINLQQSSERASIEAIKSFNVSDTSISTAAASIPRPPSAADSLDAMNPEQDASSPIIYHARFFGTDDDFLNRSEIRDFFKQCAVGAEDHLLFTLYNPAALQPILMHQAEEQTQAAALIADPTYRPGWKNVFGFFMPLGPSCLTARTGCVNAKAWLGLSVAFVIGLILLCRWVIPAEWLLFVLTPSCMAWLLMTVLFVRVDSLY